MIRALLLWGIFLSMPLCGQLENVHNKASIESLLMQAQEYYHERNFAKALECYEQLPYHWPALYAIMGQAACECGRLGHALLYWRRAQSDLGCALHEDLFSKIEQLKKNAAGKAGRDSLLVDYLLRLKDYCYVMIQALPLWTIQLLFLCLWFFLFVFVHCLYKKRRHGLILFLFLLIALCGICLLIKYRYNNHRYAIVVTSDAELFSGPDSTTFPSCGKVQQACEVRPVRQMNDYLKVKVHGRAGWLERKHVCFIA